MPLVLLTETVEPCNKLDPFYLEARRAIEITKKFISDRGLVCYGGTALDYAMRLQGSKIYDDSKLDLPDLDFYSTDPLRDARDLADILYKNGFSEARQIRALHVGTFKVDAGHNHFVADISYCPILAELRTLRYEGFLIVDPIYQRLDMHSSLSFPYDNAPREVIFDRWKKDIERYGITNEIYPLIPNAQDDQKKDQRDKGSVRTRDPKFVYTGHTSLEFLLPNSHATGSVIEICSHDIEDTISELGGILVSSYEPYFNLLPEMHFVSKDDEKYIIYSTENKLLSREKFPKNDRIYRTSCMNYTMKILLGWTLVQSRNWPWIPDTTQNISLYLDLLQGIRLSIETYGSDNVDNSTLLKSIELESKISGTSMPEEFVMPQNYRPSSQAQRGPDGFNYRINPMLRVAGQKIE